MEVSASQEVNSASYHAGLKGGTLPSDLDSFPKQFMQMMLTELRNQMKEDQQEHEKAVQNAQAAIYGRY